MRRILLLNSAYEPIRFINEKKAISLVLRGVVDIVSTWNGEHLFSRWGVDGKPLQMPATLRLSKWHNRKTRIPVFKRQVVFARDDYTCQYCSRYLTIREATIDHVVPRDQGGKLTWKNAVTSCRPCNRAKANNTPEQAGMALLKQPTSPTVVHFWDSQIHSKEKSNWHDDWDSFIPK